MIVKKLLQVLIEQRCSNFSWMIILYKKLYVNVTIKLTYQEFKSLFNSIKIVGAVFEETPFYTLSYVLYFVEWQKCRMVEDRCYYKPDTTGESQLPWNLINVLIWLCARYTSALTVHIILKLKQFWLCSAQNLIVCK